MTVSRLLQDFSRRENVPVDVTEVLSELRARGVKDKINFFHDVDLDSGILSGFLERVESKVDRKSVFISTITYGRLGPERERLVSCKELLHILDPKGHRVSTAAQVKHLASKIILPPELVDPFSDGDQVWNDRVAILEALAILFPLAARNIMYAKYMAKRASISRIAEITELPDSYVATVMSGSWPNFQAGLIARRLRIEEATAPKRSRRKSRITTMPPNQ